VSRFFFTICSSVAFCSERCKDCDPITGLTVRETIAADRMKDAKRIAEEIGPTAVGRNEPEGPAGS